MEPHKTAEQLLAELKDAQSKVQIGGIYEHYKNKQHYKVINLATQEIDDELAVIYQQLHGHKLLFTRPLKVWCEEVEWEGKTLPRFKKIG